MPPDADVPAYTFSAGVAQAQPVEPLQHLLRRADAALYAARPRGAMPRWWLPCPDQGADVLGVKSQYWETTHSQQRGLRAWQT